MDLNSELKKLRQNPQVRLEIAKTYAFEWFIWCYMISYVGTIGRYFGLEALFPAILSLYIVTPFILLPILMLGHRFLDAYPQFNLGLQYWYIGAALSQLFAVILLALRWDSTPDLPELFSFANFAFFAGIGYCFRRQIPGPKLRLFLLLLAMPPLFNIIHYSAEFGS